MKNSIQDYVREENGRRILEMKHSQNREGSIKDSDLELMTGQSKTTHHDGYKNMLTRYGTQQDSTTAYTYSAEEIIPDVDLTDQYIGNGLFSKIIDAPAEEAVKHGYDFKLNDPNVEDFISDELDRLDWEETAATAIKWSRLYGGAIIVMLVDDGCDLDEPLDWDAVEEIEELLVYERAVVEPDRTSLYEYNPEKTRRYGSKFRKPEFYTVNSQYGSFRVHESRCLIFKNGKLPETGVYSTYQYFGIPEFMRIKDALRDAVVSHGLAPKLLERCVQAIYKMKNLANMLDTTDGEEKVLKRLEVIDLARSILNSLVIDAEGEDYDFKSMPLSGVKDIIDTTCNMLSAVTNIPQTLLFGRSPAGENSTGDSDMENYYNFVSKIQKMMLKKNMRVLLDIIFKCGQKKGNVQEIPAYKVEFTPLWSLSEAEQANVDSIKATTEQTKAATAQMYVDMQVLDSTEVRAGLKKSEEYTINDLLNEEDDLDIESLLGISSPEDEETVTEEAQNNANSGRDMDSLKSITNLPQGHTEPTEEHKDNNSSRGEGVGVLIIKDGMILTGTRTDGKGICGPGGHIESGESPEEAAKRESEEEFGIVPLEMIPLGEIEPNPPELDSYIFLCTKYAHRPRADNIEMTNVHFMSLQDLLNEESKLFAPFDQSLQVLIDSLGIRQDKGNSNSGNHNHKGRPGQLGGSGGGGGLGKPLSAQQRKEYEKKIIGQKTSKGVTIKKLSKHTCDRLGQRRVSVDKIMGMIQHPETVKLDKTHGGGNKFRYTKGRYTAVVDHDNGEIVTVFKH